jgi:hypothetical protein
MEIFPNVLDENLGSREKLLDMFSNGDQRSKSFLAILICRRRSEQCSLALKDILDWKLALDKFDVRKHIRKN